MTGIARSIGVAALVLLFASGAVADTLELKDGRVLQGRFLGGTQALMRFSVNGEVQTFNVTEIVALTFTNNYGHAAGAPEPAPAPQAVASDPAPLPAGSPVTIPAGQSLLVRMIDGVDSSRKTTLATFSTPALRPTSTSTIRWWRARARTSTAAWRTRKKRAIFPGARSCNWSSSASSSTASDYPLVSSDYSLKGKGRGADTAKKVGGGAVVGSHHRRHCRRRQRARRLGLERARRQALACRCSRADSK